MFRQLIRQATASVPSQCAVCHAWPAAQPLCEACVTDFAQPQPRCLSCALPVTGGVMHCGECLLAPAPLDVCLTAVSYRFPWHELVAEFKFRNAPGWAGTFAQLLASMPGVESALARADLILPVPLSRERLRQRGFNQALELAKKLEPLKTRANLLLRVKDTPAQSTLKRAERLALMQDAFAVDPLLAWQIRGKKAVLVDDVMTSGATLHAAARALRAAGATHITGLVFARTEN